MGCAATQPRHHAGVSRGVPRRKRHSDPRGVPLTRGPHVAPAAGRVGWASSSPGSPSKGTCRHRGPGSGASGKLAVPSPPDLGPNSGLKGQAEGAPVAPSPLEAKDGEEAAGLGSGRVSPGHP